MLALLVGAVMGCVVLAAGLVLFVVHELIPSDNTRTRTAHGAGGQQSSGTTTGSAAARSAVDPRDALAAKAMAAVDDDASHPAAVSATNPGVIAIPAAIAIGPAQVPTGYPHTPAGALAQLAAIDQVAFQSGSLVGARAVIDAWAVPGGPTSNSWTLLQGMATLFSELGTSGSDGGSDGGSGSGPGQLALVLTPVMGQIKGSVGQDFTVPCIDFELDVTLAQTARGADADCQRMVWMSASGSAVNGGGGGGGVGGRWMIGAGAEPATPPSVWPDTDLAIAVGYHDLRPDQP